MRQTPLLILCCSLVGCGSAAKPQVKAEENLAARTPEAKRETRPVARPEERAERREETSLRAQVVELARKYVGLRSIHQADKQLPDDCTGFVRLVFDQVGIDLMAEGRPADSGVTAMWRFARNRGGAAKRPLRPGDLVFFRETYDRNRDGRRNDGLTHVAIVEDVLEDGTVVFIHRGGQGVARSRFNPAAPKVHYASDGRVLNDYLRARSRKLRAYLAGELWAGAASPDSLRR